ncbi:hypothetical protein DFA_09101 [Cavenderia fasciculata]|uniref:BOS complex subunit NCLN n=1 Tax=Cavenderia fasciculata TaxID=261658 RepID=F4Q6P4_CACFS|nr:uncharacterized protein DFA_09101 [Cavenderia fasciculata]EGG16554.1 hypothetical protein DFA_09101 [Cavenderia fasciculata]|eukprot:XP_004354954.1 hypothetical protein DFA_09101 [Cavenderia fasciculata]
MLQFDSSTFRFGPQRSILGAQTIRYEQSRALEDYSTYTVVIGVGHLTFNVLQSLLEQSIAGIIVTVPSTNNIGSSSTLTIASLSRLTINVPIYFVEDEDIKEDLVGGDLRLVTSDKTPSPTPITQWNVINFSGRLVGQVERGDSIVPPTVVVVAHYDTFSRLAPAFVSTTINRREQSTSGVVALLELSRIFSKLYSSADNQPAYNIIFLLTSGSATNYQGAEQWLSQQSPVVSESIDLVVCIDSLISGRSNDEPLYLHVSRPPKDNTTRQLYSDFTTSASDFGLEMNLVQKKINISSPVIYWEHEVFSRKRIPAVTVSQRKQPFDQSTEPLLLVDQPINTRSLATNIQIIAKAIINHIYANEKISKDILVAEDSVLSVNEAFIDSWSNALSRVTRSLPFVDVGQIQPAIEKLLNTYLLDVVVDSSKSGTSSGLVCYQPIQTILSFSNVKSFTFDILVFVGCIVYLIALYFGLCGKDRAFNEIKSFF